MNFIAERIDRLKYKNYHFTMDTVKKINKAKTEFEKMTILYKFIKKMWKKITPGEASSFQKQEVRNWEQVCLDLEYYSDRWCFSRLYSIKENYNLLNKMTYFDPPEIKEEE